MGVRIATRPASAGPPVWTALVWLDWHILRNRARSVARNPRRLVPWLLFLVLLAPNLAGRLPLTSSAPAGEPPPLADLLSPVEPMVSGAALAILGLALWQAAGRPPAGFQSPADGRFLVGAGIPARLVLAWLALRSARRLLLASVFYLLVLGLSLPGFGVSGRHVLVATAGVTAYRWLLFSGRLGLFALQTRVPGARVAWAGVALALLGGASMAAGMAGVRGAGVLQALPPGSLLLAALQGHAGAAVLLGALALLLAAAGTLGARDCLPDLWAASARSFELRLQMRQGVLGGLLSGRSRPGRDGRPPAAASRSAALAPPGAWALAWKEWVAVRRLRGGLQLHLGLVAAAVVAGIAAGRFTAGRPELTGVVLAYAFFLFSVLTNLVALRLARDLRSPVWWLAADPLHRRLAALTVARACRLGVPLAVFAGLLVGLAGGDPWLAAGFVVVALALAWMISALGLASYTLLPAASDLRVSQMLRVFALYAALLPVGAAVVPGVLLRSLPLVLAGGAGALVAEAALLILFAAWRLQGNGLAFAREERQ